MQKQKSEQIDSVMEFAESYDYEQSHAKQVTKLALKIFDDLKKFHKMSANEKFLLHCGSLLHDIGWINGQKSHHKTALNLIVNAANLPFDLYQRTMIGLIARYHRKSLPKASHKYFCDLKESQQHVISNLASILRVADGLDISHMNLINDLHCTFDADKIMIKLVANGNVEPEISSAIKKSDLMQKIFSREIIFEMAN